MKRRSLILPAISAITLLAFAGDKDISRQKRPPGTSAQETIFTKRGAPGEERPSWWRGLVRLVPDEKFGAGVDWASVFTRYEGAGTLRGTYKDLVRLSDGRFIVADSRAYNFLFFDAGGNFVKKLWKKGRRNSADLSTRGRPEWFSVWADQYLFVAEPGIIRVFDLDGREIRHKAIIHPVRCLVPLGEKLVALGGDVKRKDFPIQYIATVFNLETGKETMVMDSIERRPDSRDAEAISEGVKTVSVQLPFAQIRPFVRPAPEGGFLAGFSNWPEIQTYDKNGIQTGIFRLKTEPAEIEWSQIRAQAILTMEKEEEFKNRNPYDYSRYEVIFNNGGIVLKDKPVAAKKGEDETKKQKVPVYLDKAHFASTGFYQTQKTPYFYSLYNDERGKLLVFFFPSQGTDPIYQAYKPDGELVREAIIDGGEYDVLFSPGAAGAVFAEGCLYTLSEKKSDIGRSLRLMKFQMVEK